MPLNDAKLEVDLRVILQLDSNGKSNADEAIKKMVIAISAYVRAGEVQGLTADGKTVTGKLI
ncbi:hypothetical protein GFS24_10240 [Chitinophaga sp. SYP-B3965]|uniref:hypothetical protein n=1 Tax=Chitinophaga sp. SYP-B3965 TaxID=2663120 RepID=UPI0012995A9A|nr:hypothetical protein [Chitinophaga sp. SYP-B3965]MRG45496.1 hypothetical protein [Chitinophaga sp. SYP-B3965]